MSPLDSSSVIHMPEVRKQTKDKKFTMRLRFFPKRADNIALITRQIAEKFLKINNKC